MINVEKLKESEYLETLGVRKVTFDKMLEELTRAYGEQRHKGGRLNYKLTLTDKLIITLIYLREYRTMHSIAVDYNVSKNEVWKVIRWVENTLIKSEFLHIDGKKVLLNPDSKIEAILIDVTECEIERPQKKQNLYYPGKKNGT
jgi:predicted DNA-binding protein YlxM (UPF0122 family)